MLEKLRKELSEEKAKRMRESGLPEVVAESPSESEHGVLREGGDTVSAEKHSHTARPRVTLLKRWQAWEVTVIVAGIVVIVIPQGQPPLQAWVVQQPL